MRATLFWGIVVSLITSVLPASEKIELHQAGDHLRIETDTLSARINTKGYVSGVAGRSLLDKKTGARDLGFGLHIMDFLLAPGDRNDGYAHPEFHGKIAKHYVEGPQICTQAKELQPEIHRGDDFLAIRFQFTFTKPGRGYKAGSVWRQTLLFRPGLRYFFSSETITSANDHEALFYRIDMPGHVQHQSGDRFEKIWLSYHGEIPASEFRQNFPPDEKFLYQRRDGSIPSRMIRAYQVRLGGRPGPWLAGMTLDPAAVSEAWCHQRGYVCFIQELHQRPVRVGETFGAAYIVGWFDDRAEMEAVYDRYKGKSRIDIVSGKAELK